MNLLYLKFSENFVSTEFQMMVVNITQVMGLYTGESCTCSAAIYEIFLNYVNFC